MPHSVTGGELPPDWRCPVSLALCAGSYSAAALGDLSVRRLTSPFTIDAIPARTYRRVSVMADRRLLVPITAHVFAMCAAVSAICQATVKGRFGVDVDSDTKRRTLRGHMTNRYWYYA